MKIILVIISFFCLLNVSAQDNVLDRMRGLHRAMVEKKENVGSFIHDSLTYGHSNGWVETNKEFRTNMGGIITYHSYKEDSIDVTSSGSVTHIRFKAAIEATLNGVRSIFHLKVLEVWVNENNTWKLFARQAVKG